MIEAQRSQPVVVLFAIAIGSLVLSAGLSAGVAQAAGDLLWSTFLATPFFALGSLAASGRHRRAVIVVSAVVGTLLILALLALVFWSGDAATMHIYAL